MILSKRFLNEQVQKRVIHEDSSYEGLFYQRKALSNYDVFISYSWNDRAYANKVVQLLERCGYTVYIDYNDNLLNRSNVSEETARRIIQAMKKCKGLLHLYSPSASVSKWCPWEVGVFSGIKDFKCANLPLTEDYNEDFKKQEYLEIYPYVEYAKVMGTNKDEFWIYDGPNKYVTLSGWLNGTNPYVHK